MAGKFAHEVIATPEVKKHEILGPWLTERNLCLLYGPRGSGKTNIALAIAHAAASGSPLWRPAWTPHKKYRTLYFDSEMGIQAWKKKLVEIDSASSKSLSGEFLKFITPECMGEKVWNLSDREDQGKIIAEAEFFDLLIFDNLIDFSSRTDKYDSDIQNWRRVESFIKFLRDMGRTVILVHHAGKSGDQLGTIEHEKPMDTVVKLSPVSDPDFNGMRVDLTFTKARWFFGGSLQPLRISYEKLEKGQSWDAITLREAQSAWADKKVKEGWKKTDIAKVLQVTESQINELTRGIVDDKFYGPKSYSEDGDFN